MTSCKEGGGWSLAGGEDRESKLLLPPDSSLELTVELLPCSVGWIWQRGSPDGYREPRSCLPARGVSMDLWPPCISQGHVSLQTQRSFDAVEAFQGRRVAQTLRSLIRDLVPFTGDGDACRLMTSAWELYRRRSRFWPHSSLQVPL